MNTFLTICLIVLPLSLLMGFAAYLARQSAKGMPVKRTLSLNITAFVVVLLLAACFAFVVSAEGETATAAMSPTRVGRIPATVPIPSFAPSRKSSITGRPERREKPRM